MTGEKDSGRFSSSEEIGAVEKRLPRIHAAITDKVAQTFETILAQIESTGGDINTGQLMGQLVGLFQVYDPEKNGDHITAEEKRAIDSALQELAEWHRQRGVRIDEIRETLRRKSE